MQVLEPHVRRVDEGFSEARVLAEVTLLPDKIRIASGRRAVAMATGVIDRAYKNGQVQKQVLVVVTSGWSVMCFDHNLNKLWETNLQVCGYMYLYIYVYVCTDILYGLVICTFYDLCFYYFCHSYCFIDPLLLRQDDFPHNAHHREIAISISNYTLKHGDAGLVVVAGRMEVQPHVCFSLIFIFFECNALLTSTLPFYAHSNMVH